MLKFISESALVIAISLSFFVFGFVLGADFFQLSFRQVVTGLIAGAVCGVAILAVEYSRSRKQLTMVRERLSV